MSRDLLNPETVFAQAIEIESAEGRAAFLDQACGNEPELRREVEKLVVDYFKAGRFLEKPAAHIVATVDDPITERPGTVIGPYKLLEQIGEGGFGVVFMAEQTHPVRRKVALKVIKPGMDSRQVIARFEAERQALAIMDHPNIAKVLDAGTTGSEPEAQARAAETLAGAAGSGRPYFVMELVRGVPITEYCDQNQLTPRERLELFIPVCHAVQHAHQKGIIHRDIKPSNAMVTLHDGTPVPKIIDFGIAKAMGQQLTDKTLFTNFAQMIGTPLYMSPEQAGLSGLDVDTRSDIYSLGVLLYELLTGTTPFDKERFKEAGYDEIRRIIREEEPPKPSTRLSDTWRVERTARSAENKTSKRRGASRSTLRALRFQELDWIVMKALEKDRNRRYETANSLARDIERYLHDEPVQACPPSAAYKFRKFARRNKAALLTAALVFVTIVVGFAVSTVLIAQERDAAQAAAKGQAVAAQQAKDAAQQAKDAAQQAKDAAQQAKDQEAIAQQERDRAERHYQAARATVDRMFTRAAGELQSVPHTEKIRRALLEDALGFYQEFLKAKADDPSLRLETALAAVRVGTIRFILGQFREALPPLRLGLSLLEELAKRFPAEPRYRVEMAQAHFMLAQATHWLGEGTEEMIAHRRKRVALFDGLHHDFPATPQYLMQAASAHADFGCNLQAKGFPNESLEQFEKAAALFKKHRTDFPNEPEDPHFVGYIDHWRGAALERLGRLQDAELSYRKAHDFRKRLVAEQPRVALYVFELGHIKAYLANLLMNSGRLAEAAQLWREALLIHEKLRDDFPDSTDLGHKTGTDYDGLGTVLSAMGRTAEAETALRRSLAIRAKIAADAQANEFHSLQLAWAHYHLGVLLHSTGKSKEAADAFREAIAIVEKIVAQHPDIPQYQSQLASILATCPAVQFRDPQRAVKLAKQALQRQPQVARHWGVLGVAQYRANDPAAAIESLSKRMEMLDAVGSQWLWFVMAMAHHKLGNHPQARQWYDKAAAWMDKNQPPDEDYGRFRAEAAELLGIKEQKKNSPQSPRRSQKKD